MWHGIAALLGIREEPWTPQLAMGGVGSGSNVHFHSTAINVALSGRKEWIFPVDDLIWSHLPIKDYGRLDANDRPPALRCSQAAGDAMLVPAGWTHGVLNAETPSTAVAWEWIHSADMGLSWSEAVRSELSARRDAELRQPVPTWW